MPKGFSLVELMVVISIIAILSAVGSVSYREYSIKAKVHSALGILNSFARDAIELDERNELNFPFTINGVNFTASSAFVYDVAPVVTVQYFHKGTNSPGVESNQFMFCVNVATLNGLAVDDSINSTAYEEPTTSSRGARNRVCVRKTYADSIYTTDCGVWDPNNDEDIPYAVLPSGCQCRNILNSTCT